MKKNKLALALVGIVSVFTLAACSSGTDLVTMKGGKITVEEFFDEIKSDQQVQGNLTNAIIFKVASQNYGDKVTKEDIAKAYKDQSKQYGDTFAEQLKASGYTEASYKEKVIKKSLAFEAMQKAHIKINDEDLKETWKTYHPEVEAQVILLETEKDAKEALEKAKKGDDFGKLAREKSGDASSAENGKIKFDSTTQNVAPEAKEAAYKLKDGEISDIITVKSSNGTEEVSVFYIFKMIKNQEKGSDWKPFKKELKKVTMDAKLSDQELMHKTISEELKKANVKIKDESLKSVLANYIEEETVASSTEATEATK